MGGEMELEMVLRDVEEFLQGAGDELVLVRPQQHPGLGAGIVGAGVEQRACAARADIADGDDADALGEVVVGDQCHSGAGRDPAARAGCVHDRNEDDRIVSLVVSFQ